MNCKTQRNWQMAIPSIHQKPREARVCLVIPALGVRQSYCTSKKENLWGIIEKNSSKATLNKQDPHRRITFLLNISNARTPEMLTQVGHFLLLLVSTDCVLLSKVEEFPSVLIIHPRTDNHLLGKFKRMCLF